MTARDGRDGAGRRGIRSPADLPRIARERERVASAYRKWAFDLIMQALTKSDLVNRSGLAERIGVMNGICVAAVLYCKTCGATKAELLRIMGELWDQVSRDGGPTPAASPESEPPSDAPSGLPSRPGPETH